jgi:hypothetical protein
VEQEQIINCCEQHHVDLEHKLKEFMVQVYRTANVSRNVITRNLMLLILFTDKEEQRKSELRLKHAKQRLENLYPDSHTLDVI